jgi:tight adherence protein B
MSGLTWCLPAGLLLVAVAVRVWTRRSPLRRLRGAPSRRRGASSRRTPNLAATRARLTRLGTTDPRRLTLLTAAAAGGIGMLAGGPVASLVVAAYSIFGVRATMRRVVRRAADTQRARCLDDLCALAAELRAGLPPQRVAAVYGDDRISELTGAVWRLAERTGAPAADLVERIESDARTADRAARSAAAQAAGAQATAMLLAALPIGGIGLGYSIGADPLHILLHTRLGAACAVGAVLLQCAGLLWADRLVTGAP